MPQPPASCAEGMEKEGHPASKKCIKRDLFIEKQGGNMQLEESTEKSMTQLHSVITNIHVHLSSKHVMQESLNCIIVNRGEWL